MHPCVDIMISALLGPQPLAHSRQQNRARHGYDAPLAPELIGWLKELRNSASTARANRIGERLASKDGASTICRSAPSTGAGEGVYARCAPTSRTD
eukprot:gene48370-65627_t